MAQGQRLLNPGGLMGPTQAPMVLSTPFNDVQLVAMMAAQLGGDPAESVEKAQEMVAHAIAKSARLQELIQALTQEPALT